MAYPDGPRRDDEKARGFPPRPAPREGRKEGRKAHGFYLSPGTPLRRLRRALGRSRRRPPAEGSAPTIPRARAFPPGLRTRNAGSAETRTSTGSRARTCGSDGAPHPPEEGMEGKRGRLAPT